MNDLITRIDMAILTLKGAHGKKAQIAARKVLMDLATEADEAQMALYEQMAPKRDHLDKTRTSVNGVDDPQWRIMFDRFLATDVRRHAELGEARDRAFNAGVAW